MMEHKDEQILIECARKGDSAALGELSTAVQPRIRAYLLRVTLNHALADDLTQETLLEMVQSIEALREPKGFWSWLYRIAMSKYQTHFRRERLRRVSEEAFDGRFSDPAAAEQGHEALARLLKTEVSRHILSAIEQLKPRDRAVLSLRCFDEMPYPDIAQTLETTESNARILFFRAKLALKKELLRRGLKGSALVMALSLFGSLTESASCGTAGGSAAGSLTVSASSVNVSLGTALSAVCGTKVVCAILLSLITMTGLLTTAGVVYTLHDRRTRLPERAAVRSFHFTAQSGNNVPGAPESLSKGAYEQWYYFPDGIDGALFFRMQRWDPQQQIRQCAWLQNGQANYYWHSGDNVVYLTNRRLWSRSLTQIRIRRLPTDEPALTAFLDRMEGGETAIQVRRDPRTGLTAETADFRFVDAAGFTSRYDYNQTEAALFENPWTNIPVIDERDAMRRRGWGYFSIDGSLDGMPVTGHGRMPFFYDYSTTYSAWLVIDLPDGGRLVDTAAAAVVLDASGAERARYAGGRFFTGLLRPWMGMHTIDCVRRDAAHQAIAFTTTHLSDFHKTGSVDDYYADARVVCTTFCDGREATIDYLIDIKNDLLKTIVVKIADAKGHARQLHLTFRFHPHLPESGAMEAPSPDLTGRAVQPDNGPRWLIDLAGGTL